ncbi:MAG: VOC family protein [Evtepia sp.]
MKFTLTTLEVSNLERSVRFYRDSLGLPLIERFLSGSGAQIAMLGDPDSAHLELIQKETSDATESHEGFSVGFKIAHAGILAASLDPNFVGPISPNPRLKFYFIRDPDGYRVQLIDA